MRLPAERLDLRTIESHHRDIAFPPSVAAGELVASVAGSKAAYLHGQVRNFLYGNAIVGSNVEDVIPAGCLLVREANRRQDICHVNVALPLRAISQDPQARWICSQATNEVVANPMSLPGP